MSNSKPEPQVRRPPADDEEKVAAFISGDDGDEEAEQEESRAEEPDDEAMETERIAIYFEKSTAKRLRMYCAEKGRPMSRVVDEWAAGELEDWEPDF